MFQRFKTIISDLRSLHFIYLGRKWCANLNACVLSEAFMILCPPELLGSVKLETIAEGNEEGFSLMPVKILAVIMFIVWLFGFIFLR